MITGKDNAPASLHLIRRKWAYCKKDEDKSTPKRKKAGRDNLCLLKIIKNLTFGAETLYKGSKSYLSPEDREQALWISRQSP